jgi:hypothetical protein
MTFSSKAIGSVAVSAALTSVALAVVAPYGQPWTSLSFAVVACALAVWARQSLAAPLPSMSDVIREIEAEGPRVPGSRRRRSSTSV